MNFFDLNALGNRSPSENCQVFSNSLSIRLSFILLLFISFHFISTKNWFIVYVCGESKSRTHARFAFESEQKKAGTMKSTQKKKYNNNNENCTARSDDRHGQRWWCAKCGQRHVGIARPVHIIPTSVYQEYRANKKSLHVSIVENKIK